MPAEKNHAKRLAFKLRYRGPKKTKITSKDADFVAGATPPGHIEKHLDSLNNSDVTVEVLAHVAQRIIRPPFLWSQAAHLLGLLAHLERLRVSTVEQAGMALAAIEQYHGYPAFHLRIPPDDEVARLRAMADKDTGLMRRTEYHHLTLQIRWMHLARILISRDLPLFDKMLDVYFPPLADQHGWETRPYLDYLSPEEKQDEILKRESLVGLRVSSERWREERETWWKSHYPDMLEEVLYGDARFFSYEKEFLREFPPTADLETLVQLIEHWILRVKVQIETLEEIFTLPEGRTGVLKLVQHRGKNWMLPIVPATNVLTTNDRTCDPITKLFGQLEVSPVEPGALRGLGRQAGGSSYTGDRDADDPHSHSLEYSSENDGGPSNSDAPAGFNSSPPSSVMRMGGESTSDSEGQSPRSCVKGDIEEAPAIDFRTGAYGTTDFEEDDVVESERQIRLTTDSGNEADGYDSSELGESHTSGTSSPRSGSPIQSIYSFHSSGLNLRFLLNCIAISFGSLDKLTGTCYARFMVERSNENYMLPADSEEQSRLDLQHAALTLFLGDLYPSPHLVEEVLRPIGGYTPGILDIGTGSGSWALAMARKYPHAEVIGLDLVPPLVALSKIPDNCRFEVQVIPSSTMKTNKLALLQARGDLGEWQWSQQRLRLLNTAYIDSFRWIQKFFGATLVAVKFVQHVDA
ncbi:hypothetical protein FRB96_001168 [Tulasnella sp. 330]|nr:hypothetical protein FRB96_001168 [Tulasnella sp. 330]